MVTVIARYETLPGQGDAVAAVLARHVAASRAEPGCLQFVAERSQDDGDHFVLYERYVDEAAFDAHRDSPHFQRNVVETIAPLLAERAWARYDEVVPQGI